MMLKGLIIAFSMYSKLPMPHVAWKDKDMRYAVCFFPMVGLVIGGCMYLWFTLCNGMEISTIARSCVAAAIVLLITGGIHLDGYMDTSDALHSYGNREKKLEILKDPHIGAFSIIMTILYYLLYLAAVSELEMQVIPVYALGFFLSRICSGLSIVYFKNAKKEGTLYTFSTTAHKKWVRFILLLELLGCSAVMMYVNLPAGGITLLLTGGTMLLYHHVSYREFGGITGDLAGWFLCISELATVCGLALWAQL